jgi:hypothetical protein
MSYVTVEVQIDHGRIVPREPDKLPETGSGLLTILPPANGTSACVKPARQRVQLPLIRCKPGTVINPTPEELDASFWGD